MLFVLQKLPNNVPRNAGVAEFTLASLAVNLFLLPPPFIKSWVYTLDCFTSEVSRSFHVSLARHMSTLLMFHSSYLFHFVIRPGRCEHPSLV